MLGIGRIQHSGLRSRRGITAGVHGHYGDAAEDAQQHQLPPGSVPAQIGRQDQAQGIEGLDKHSEQWNKVTTTSVPLCLDHCEAERCIALTDHTTYLHVVYMMIECTRKQRAGTAGPIERFEGTMRRSTEKNERTEGHLYIIS